MFSIIGNSWVSGAATWPGTACLHQFPVQPLGTKIHGDFSLWKIEVHHFVNWNICFELKICEKNIICFWTENLRQSECCFVVHENHNVLPQCRWLTNQLTKSPHYAATPPRFRPKRWEFCFEKQPDSNRKQSLISDRTFIFTLNCIVNIGACWGLVFADCFVEKTLPFCWVYQPKTIEETWLKSLV